MDSLRTTAGQTVRQRIQAISQDFANWAHSQQLYHMLTIFSRCRWAVRPGMKFPLGVSLRPDCIKLLAKENFIPTLQQEPLLARFMLAHEMGHLNLTPDIYGAIQSISLKPIEMAFETAKLTGLIPSHLSLKIFDLDRLRHQIFNLATDAEINSQLVESTVFKKDISDILASLHAKGMEIVLPETIYRMCPDVREGAIFQTWMRFASMMVDQIAESIQTKGLNQKQNDTKDGSLQLTLQMQPMDLTETPENAEESIQVAEQLEGIEEISRALHPDAASLWGEGFSKKVKLGTKLSPYARMILDKVRTTIHKLHLHPSKASTFQRPHKAVTGLPVNRSTQHMDTLSRGTGVVVVLDVSGSVVLYNEFVREMFHLLGYLHRSQRLQGAFSFSCGLDPINFLANDEVNIKNWGGGTVWEFSYHQIMLDTLRLNKIECIFVTDGDIYFSDEEACRNDPRVTIHYLKLDTRLLAILAKE